MQLIQQYYSLLDAEYAALALRQEGIITHISSKHSFNMSGYVTGAFKVGLWSVLDGQHQDACDFICDNNHEVTTGISEQEMVELESSSDMKRIVNQFLIHAIAGLAVFTATLAYVMNKV